MPASSTRPLRTEGTKIVDGGGEPVRLKGVNVGGWLNMENFITGYAGNESMMRAAVRDVLGPDNYELFFDRLLSAFYADADAAFLASLGLNCVRIPLNYRHLESPRTGSTASSTCTPCRAGRTTTGTPTTRRTGRCSGSTRTSRTASCTCGRRSPTATRAIHGSSATT
jgi:hypothetical protein